MCPDPAGSGAAALASDQQVLRRFGPADSTKPSRQPEVLQQQLHRLLPEGNVLGAELNQNRAGSDCLCLQMSAVAVALVSDGSRCLLGRQPSFPRGLYSALAGFCDMGQTHPCVCVCVCRTHPCVCVCVCVELTCVCACVWSQVRLWRRRSAGRWRRRWVWRSRASPTAPRSTGRSRTAPSCWAATPWLAPPTLR